MSEIPEMVFVPDRPCPRCGTERVVIDLRPYTIPDLPKQPTFIAQRPTCRGEFCGNCFKTDYDGNGHTIVCPHCRTTLCFPDHFTYGRTLN